MGEKLGNPGILGQGGGGGGGGGGYLVHPILGYSWDGRDTWTRGVLILGCFRDGGDTWESRDTWTRGGI